MYKNEPNKTWVDMEPNSVNSFFVIGEPQYGQYDYDTPDEKDCSIFGGLLTQPYPCCFLFETLAAICLNNPGLSDGSNNELEQNYISVRMESNMTMAIDMKFYVDLKYSQDFFPIYFGKEVYQGYSGDLYFTCACIKFPYVK